VSLLSVLRILTSAAQGDGTEEGVEEVSSTFRSLAPPPQPTIFRRRLNMPALNRRADKKE